MPDELDTTEVEETIVDPDVEDVVAEPEVIDPEEYKALKAKLKKANDEAKTHRLKANQLATANETDVDAAVRTTREEVETSVTNKWRPLVINSAAKSELANAGCLISADKALKLLDLSDVEVDTEDGTITGLTEAVRQAKRDNPEFFARKGAAQINAGDRDSTSTAGAPKSAAEKLAAQLLGQR